MYFYYFLSNHSYSLIFVLFVLNFILLQGSFYWFVNWKKLKDKSVVSPNLFKLYSAFKKMNILFICTVPFILLMDVIILRSTSFPVYFLVIFVYAFTIVEYINYFHIQLTNYRNGRGKKTSIAKGIQKSKDFK